MKESFIMHNSFYEPIKILNDEQLGRLFRAIFDYTGKGIITQDNEILVAFMFIKNQIDIDANKWEETKQKRSEAGKKGMQNRWHNKDNNVIDSYNKDNNVINDITNITDNVNVNVNDNVNVINKERKYIKKESFKKPTLDEIKEYCKERDNNIDAERFYNFYESKGWMVGKNKMKDWKACVRTWEQKNNKKEETSLPNWWNKNFKKDMNNLDELNNILEGF